MKQLACRIGSVENRQEPFFGGRDPSPMQRAAHYALDILMSHHLSGWLTPTAAKGLDFVRHAAWHEFCSFCYA
jgi:hypothetical protein